MKVQEHVPTVIQDDRHNVKYLRSQRENTRHCVRDTASVRVLDWCPYERTRDYYFTL